MLPPCTSCVPSCSLFPRSPGGKVMLPPLTSPQDCTMTNNHAHQGWKQVAPVELSTNIHPPCSCHRNDCICPSSSSGEHRFQHESTAHGFNGHDHILNQRHPMPVAFSRQPPSSPIPFSHDQQNIHPLKTTAAISSPTDITPSSQPTAKAEPVTSSVRTFRFKNASVCGQNPNRRETKSPSHRPSPSDTDGSLKEINITRRARRQIYLKPDVEGSPFRLLMYVDCRSVDSVDSVEPQQDVG